MPDNIERLITDLKKCGSMNFYDHEKVLTRAVVALQCVIDESNQWHKASEYPPIGNPTRADFVPVIQCLAICVMPDRVPEYSIDGQLVNTTEHINPTFEVTDWRPYKIEGQAKVVSINGGAVQVVAP